MTPKLDNDPKLDIAASKIPQLSRNSYKFQVKEISINRKHNQLQFSWQNFFVVEFSSEDSVREALTHGGHISKHQGQLSIPVTSPFMWFSGKDANAQCVTFGIWMLFLPLIRSLGYSYLRMTTKLPLSPKSNNSLDNSLSLEFAKHRSECHVFAGDDS